MPPESETPEAAEASTPPPEAGKAILKLVLELGPLVLFFALNKWLEGDEQERIVGATLGFVIAVAVAFPLAWRLERKLPVMSLVTALFVGGFGGLTIWLEDKVFVQLKPTVASAFLALVLLGGLAFGKVFLRALLGAAMPMTEAGWRALTIRWSLFFLLVALLNEVVRRTQSWDDWLFFKAWIILPMTFVFTIFQLPLMKRHELVQEESESA